MAPSPGTRLRNFEVIDLPGVGGRDEVNRTRDIRLGREVAISVLPVTSKQTSLRARSPLKDG